MSRAPEAGNAQKASLPWKNIAGFALALAVMFICQSIPFSSNLSASGHGVLSVLLFMVVLWVTEAVSFPISAFCMIAALTMVVGFTHDPATGKLIGTTKAMSMALSGFMTGGWLIVVAALLLAAAFETTGLGQRMGLVILTRVGTKPRQIRLGVLATSFFLSLFIPAQTANAALMTAVGLGLIRAFKLDLRGNFAKGIMLIVAFSTSIAGVGVLTSGAPPIQTAEFIRQATQRTITWFEWLGYGMPFAIVLGLMLFAFVEILFPVENTEIEGCKELIAKEREQLGPITPQERNLLIIMLVTIFLWATNNILHSIDSSSVALMAVVCMFLPGIEVAKWKTLSDKVSWGTLMLFGAAISIGQAMLTTGAASWVAKSTLINLGMNHWPPVAVIFVAGLFFAVMSLAFSARTAAVSALVPMVIAFAQSVPEMGVPAWGLTLVLFYAIQFSTVLPVNTPMAVIAYTSNTFTSSDMMRVGVPLTFCSVIMMVVFALTYWKWLGVL
jgi:anion transporter